MMNAFKLQKKFCNFLFLPNITRSFSIQPAEVKNLDSLIKMRKETGYSYAKCRKALAKFGEQNYSEALRWIKEVAVKEGWEKAAKLSDRNASQGLCALITGKNIAALIELNCETDFVAKNDEFRGLAQQLTTALFKHAENALNSKSDYKTNFNGELNSLDVSTNEIKLPNGHSFEELIVSSIGKLGEKISLNCAKIFYTSPEFNIFGHSHPNEKFGNVEMGRFVSIVSMKRREENSGFPIEKLGRQICHHIIGMVPETLGEPNENKEINEVKEISENEEKMDDDESGDSSENTTKIDENESQLMRQAFMLNPRQTVFEYLDYHGADVKDFLRLELGQSNE
ncbi:unnamed protein product [Meloidogyne enterolobii]|uniref:Uncharacterized protein n=1 Tax=Meloidogyne enterolobii TaxID=390850 RepID=A0ACB0Y701_MELEN